jgi:hypothetical protein
VNQAVDGGEGHGGVREDARPFSKWMSKYPPAKPGALEYWPLKAAGWGR